jgi:hypothetical protein
MWCVRHNFLCWQPHVLAVVSCPLIRKLALKLSCCTPNRYTYLLDILLAAGRHVLCVGETGTGKTLTVSAKLLAAMPPDVAPVCLTFSARTSANQTQDILDGCVCVSVLGQCILDPERSPCLLAVLSCSSKHKADLRPRRVRRVLAGCARAWHVVAADNCRANVIAVSSWY